MRGRSVAPRDESAEDAELVAGVLRGETRRFDDLVVRYQRRAVATAYRLLGNREDAVDVAQDAFLKAYRSIDQLTDHARFGGWLLRIVRNLSLNFRRSRAGAPTAMGDGIELSEIGRAADGSALVEAASQGTESDADEVRVVIDAAMKELPEKQRMSLVLASVEGIPQKEVAQMLGCTVELVKWNVFQARKTLKRVLAERFGDDAERET